MSKYIIDMLGDIDETLLDEALDLPQQAEEVAFEHNERRRRVWGFGAAGVIAASLAVVAGVALFRANFGRISALPGDKNPSGGSVPKYTVDGIVIPNVFTEDDRELQQILNDIDDKALEICEVFGYYNGYTYEYRTNFYLLFPQMEKPVSFQFDTYPYFIDYPRTFKDIQTQLTDSLTGEASAEFLKSIVKGTITDGDYGDTGLTVNITEGGVFNDKGYLTEPPHMIDMDNGSIYRSSKYTGRNFRGYWSTAKVISRTDDEFIFSYIYEYDGDLRETKGRLVNENGWKFSWCGEWIF